MKLKKFTPLSMWVLALGMSQILNAQTDRKPIGNLLVEGITAPTADLTERWEQYQNIRGASVADWDAKGQGLYIATRFANTAQIHHVARPAAHREQITFFKEPITGANVCPDANRDGFLFTRDNGGDENFQVYYFDRKNGSSRLLTDGKSRNGGAKWNTKGTKIIFTSVKQNSPDINFHMRSLDKDDTEVLLENKGNGWSIADWSKDESKLLVVNYVSINESKLFIYDIASKKMTQIRPSDKQIAYSDATFTHDGKGIFLISDEDTEFAALRYYDLATQKMSKIVELDWDIQGFDLSKDGATLIFSANENGYSKLYKLNTKSMKHTPIQIPNGVLGGVRFNDDGVRVALSLTTATASSDAYVLDLKTNKLERWTFSELGGLNAQSFVDCSLITFPTFDKDERTGKPRMIPAFLYMPKNANGKTPVVVDIHGGPEGQSLPNFSNFRQFLANELGIAVLVPNVRGSSGYGKTYVKLDNGMLRENSVKDIGALLDWVAKQPNLDASKVAVYGGSYGGYMSLACMTNYNDRFRCGVDLFGISNFVSFLKNTSAYRVDLRRVEYGDERDPKMAAHLQKISPLTNIKNITKPMFIYQGANDPRVPLSESEQMVEALKKNGNEVWYVMAKDEGHGIAKKANRDYTMAAIAMFFKKYLLEK